ncbi:DUF2752 domain-containing protein [Luteimicrobium album]|uniref:DUF2752 domain-containing protein n=1 Tax=Luteimicrobium album TaxID=1054550 RepID=UPI0024E04F52|nr:DUF2752 domain-containing protein [Luteimicrobium album]
MGVATAWVGVVDPNHPGRYPVCPLYALTGLYCPLCGGLRATHGLARLDLADAWAHNPVWTVAAPLLVLAWADWVWRRWRGRPARRVPRAAVVALVVVLLAFTVARNVPAWSPWLAP